MLPRTFSLAAALIAFRILSLNLPNLSVRCNAFKILYLVLGKFESHWLFRAKHKDHPLISKTMQSNQSDYTTKELPLPSKAPQCVCRAVHRRSLGPTTGGAREADQIRTRLHFLACDRRLQPRSNIPQGSARCSTSCRQGHYCLHA